MFVGRASARHGRLKSALQRPFQSLLFHIHSARQSITGTSQAVSLGRTRQVA